MKKIINLTIAGALFVITGCSSKHEINRVPSNVDSLSYVKQVEFERGYQKAQDENREKWINIGFSRAKDIIRQWGNKIKSYEAGKYALQRGLVTNPELVFIDNADGTTTVKSVGCKVAKVLSPDDIIDLYKNTQVPNKLSINMNKANSNKTGNYSSNNSDGNYAKNKVRLIDQYKYNNNKNYITNVNSINKTVYKNFKKTATNKSILSQFGISCNSTEFNYQCNFKNKETMQDFCTKSRLCYKSK